MSAENEEQELQPETNIYFDYDKVDALWNQKRKDTKRPSKQRVGNAITKSDIDQDGALNKNEANRLVEAFRRKAAAQGVTLPNQDIFQMFDADRDGKLDEKEVQAAMMVMWLMEGDGVNWDELCSGFEKSIWKRMKNFSFRDINKTNTSSKQRRKSNSPSQDFDPECNASLKEKDDPEEGMCEACQCIIL